MKKIILAAVGLAMFATPLAAGTPHSGYSVGERHVFGGVEVNSPSQTKAAPEGVLVTPAGADQSFGLTLPANPASHSSGSHQEPRDRYGPIHR